MSFPFTFQKSQRSNRRILDLLKPENEPLVVWWYGGIRKNIIAPSMPTCVVFLKKSRGGAWVPKNIPVFYLGLLRIGSVWENGMQVADADLTIETCDVNFSTSAWQFVSPYECHQWGKPSPVLQEDYPLRYGDKDHNWLIHFPLPNEKNLLIPCMEFFTRMVGHHANVRRILMMDPWPDSIERLSMPFDAGVDTTGVWPVKLRTSIHNDDATLIAHLLHDHHAQTMIKGINAQLLTAPAGHNFVFPKIGPWFEGPARIRLAGLWINNGMTFLGLRILGASEPADYPPILIDRENSNKVEATAKDGADQAWPNTGKIENFPEVVDIASVEPDQGSPIGEIDEEPFEILGKRREVRHHYHERAKTAHGGGIKKPVDVDALSGGEPHGQGKHIGQASIESEPIPPSTPSGGVLRKMWAAMQDFLANQRIDALGSYDGTVFVPAPDMQLAPIPPYAKTDKTSGKFRNWPYLDIGKKTARRVLIARIKVAGRIVYVLEIERRSRKGGQTEESFKGLAFALADGVNVKPFMDALLLEVRRRRGLLDGITISGMRNSQAFRHVETSGDNGVPYRKLTGNILKKTEED